MKRVSLLTLLTIVLFTACRENPQPVMSVDKLGIEVTPEQNREYSYSDKHRSYYYGRTHQDHFAEWYAGWNIKQRRIVSDYDLYVDTTHLSRRQAQVTVYPHYLNRRFDHAVEQMAMVDELPILSIRLTDIEGDSIAIALDTTLISQPRYDNGILWYTPRETPDSCLAVAPQADVVTRYVNGSLQAPASAQGFILTYGTRQTCIENIAIFRSQADSLLNARKERMNNLIMKSNPIKSNIDSLDHAIAWLLLTTDQLVTHQQGYGIYAGLPWFNEYWGRDMFISMPGATLVNGEFDITRQILSDFSRLQDVDPKSPTLGRIPNRANVDGILYNTTDGTPRFVMQVADYVRYSGDTAFIRHIYPAVYLCTNAAIAHFTDTAGYLCHADADTWMDVKRKGIPGSPRGNRANDIQALWYQQLTDAAYMARYMGYEITAVEWETRAEIMREAFMRDYCDTVQFFIADHLNPDGSRDMQVRPNQLYALDLVDDYNFRRQVTRRVWEELVYPWGVGSLSQLDDNFHPQHENWHYYHKDDAYHNGTVWLWNNGHAMQRMIEMGQPDIAWQLFKNMNRQALAQGAVGSLSENADAHPREGAAWANRSGTFLQAWSNAEQLRVWYQYFLGIRPDMVNHVITLNPCLPSDVTSITYSQRVGKGDIIGTYERTTDKTIYAYMLRNEDALLRIEIPLFAPIDIEAHDADAILLTVQDGRLTLQVKNADGTSREESVYEPDPTMVQRDAENKVFFEGTQFCQPIHRDNLHAFDTYHEEALTYE
ncbi:MAG: hypothetical protein IKM35_02525 [Bacteroidaceae bacterium]|nr:hypothetical protein [Bacteroidaceae bacterium]